MPRIRSIKPELWQSPEVMNLSPNARLLFIGLITQADDDGKGSGDARKLKATIFGGDDISLSDVRSWLTEIATQRLAVLYTVDGFGDLYWLPSWHEHQYVQKHQPSRYPHPVDNLIPERYRNGNGTLPGDLKDRKDLKGSDGRARGDRSDPGLKAGSPERAPDLKPEERRRNLQQLKASLGGH